MDIATTAPIQLVRVTLPHPLNEDNEQEWDRVGKEVIMHAHREVNWDPECGPFNFQYIGQVRHGSTWHAYFIPADDC